MYEITVFVILGLTAGFLSGLLGIGGGIIIVPALVLIFGFTQHQAQGTTLALMIPPIGLLAALTYYQKGFVNLKVALLICLGFILGGFFGAKIAVTISVDVLKRIYGIALLAIGIKMVFFK